LGGEEGGPLLRDRRDPTKRYRKDVDVLTERPIFLYIKKIVFYRFVWSFLPICCRVVTCHPVGLARCLLFTSSSVLFMYLTFFFLKFIYIYIYIYINLTLKLLVILRIASELYQRLDYHPQTTDTFKKMPILTKYTHNIRATCQNGC
jgi:hypothetical protein